jgi:hypothetical protein
MPRKEQTPSEAFFTKWVAHLLCLTASNCQTDHAAISGSNSCCRKGEPLDSRATAAGSLPGRVCRTGTAIACACSAFSAFAVRACADPTLRHTRTQGMCSHRHSTAVLYALPGRRKPTDSIRNRTHMGRRTGNSNSLVCNGRKSSLGRDSYPSSLRAFRIDQYCQRPANLPNPTALRPKLK